MAKYDALVFDLDGTAIPKRADGMPSPRLIEAVAAAKKVCHVSVATGRPLEICHHILEELDIDDLCVLNGGTQLYSRKTKDFVWKQEIDPLVLSELFGKLQKFGHYDVSDERMLTKVSPGSLNLKDPTTFPRICLTDYKTDEPIGLPCIFGVSIEDAAEIVSIAKELDALHVLSMSGWRQGTVDIHISHELATKKHGLQSLLSHLNVQVDRVMVAGDGGNDVPLFELAGWKVAMGNAPQELKDLADWVAPSIDDDGLAVAIEKFILQN